MSASLRSVVLYAPLQRAFSLSSEIMTCHYHGTRQRF